MPRTSKGGDGSRSKVRVESDTNGMSIDAQLVMLANSGILKDAILTCITESRPELCCCIADVERREKIAGIHKIKPVPDYDEKRARSLYEQVGKVQNRVAADRRENDILGTSEDTRVYTKGEMKYVPVRRISTGITLLDWLFGDTKEFKQWGMPEGAVSLAAGAPGVGKTRLLLTISNIVAKAEWSKNNDTGGVLYFQGECDITQFAGLSNGFLDDKINFRASTAGSLGQMISLAQKYRPKLIVVDSVQMIKEANNMAGLQRAINVFKGLAQSLNAHVILIGQLNKAGEVAGSRKFSHLVDIVLRVKHWHIPGHFSVEVPEKNRYGRTGGVVEFAHRSNAVVCVDKRRVDPTSGEAVEEGEMTILDGIKAISGEEPADSVLGNIANEE